MNHLNLTFISILGSLLILPTTGSFPLSRTYSSPNSVLLANTLSPAEIRQLASAIAVKVLSNNQRGSGVLIAKSGQTYTVVTNAHVISASKAYRIQTPDGLIHLAVVKNQGSSLEGNDLAVLQFQSKENYWVVSLATASDITENQPVYAAGFPFDSQELAFSTGKISLVSPKPFVGGYQIGYTNEIIQGMSGGPLLNQEGKLIGVNGLLNYPILNDAYVYQDNSSPSADLRQRLREFSFAVPIQTLAQVAPQLAVIPSEWRNHKQFSNQQTLTGLAGKIDRIAQMARTW